MKLVNGINLEEDTTNINKDQHSISKPKNNNDVDSNVDKPTFINKTINIDRKIELCDICVKSKHTRIVKSKMITLAILEL